MYLNNKEEKRQGTVLCLDKPRPLVYDCHFIHSKIMV